MSDAWLHVVDGAGCDKRTLRALIRRQLAGAKVLRITGASPRIADADARAFWREIGEAIGRNADLIEDSVTGELIQVDGQWMDVRFEPDRADTYRHHNVGQPLHTDGAYVGLAHTREIALFYLARQAERGGESLFIDAETVAAVARDRDPPLFHRLFATPVRFGKGSGPQRVTPILRQEEGATKINWNYFRVLPDQGEAIAALREDFFQFLERLVNEGIVSSFRLNEGDAVFFHDEEVLHGRRAFAARESGDRLLWKTYFTLDRGARAEAAA
jgi:alpha-ketoglutarate-dependent taurine dioxygenase